MTILEAEERFGEVVWLMEPVRVRRHHPRFPPLR